MRVAVLLIGSLFLWSGCAKPDASPTLSVNHRILDAFNRQDAGAMAALVSVEFELYYVGDDGVAELAVRGREQLRGDMEGYFAANPDVRSSIVDAIDGPVYVAYREQIEGGQSSIAVCEIRDGLVRRTWYYPAE